jgi:hypothetical protein
MPDNTVSNVGIGTEGAPTNMTVLRHSISIVQRILSYNIQEMMGTRERPCCSARQINPPGSVFFIFTMVEHENRSFHPPDIFFSCNNSLMKWVVIRVKITNNVTFRSDRARENTDEKST